MLQGAASVRTEDPIHRAAPEAERDLSCHDGSMTKDAVDLYNIFVGINVNRSRRFTA
jgi:hypothetical protein